MKSKILWALQGWNRASHQTIDLKGLREARVDKKRTRGKGVQYPDVVRGFFLNPKNLTTIYEVWQHSTNFVMRLGSYLRTFPYLVSWQTPHSWFASGTHLPLYLTGLRRFLNNEVKGSLVQTHLPILEWFQTLEILDLWLTLLGI